VTDTFAAMSVAVGGIPTNYNLADLWEAVSDRVADRVAIVCGDRRVTYAELEARANALAHHLAGVGIGPGDHVGVQILNGPEYIETMLAAFKLRAVPVNINTRYVTSELRYLFDNAGLVALVHGPEFAERVDEVAPEVPTLRHRLEVGTSYDAAIAASPTTRPEIERYDDDLYLLYTGGTTGLPKGVVWRHDDCFFACIGGGDPMRLNGQIEQPAELLDRIIDFDFVAYPTAPMMHAAAQWTSLSWLYCGARVVLSAGSFDPVAVWRAVETEKVATLIIVGDAMARPLIDAYVEHGPFDTSSMFAFASGGAPLTPSLKARLMELLPNTMITDGFGSSETGAQGSQRLQPGEAFGGNTRFQPMDSGTVVLGDDLRPVEPGSGAVGKVALRGRVPIGYHGDPERTAATFPVIDGVRHVVTGDMATVEPDGTVTLLGRGSVSINTGGEKVFPEEVEGVVKAHPAVYDAIVVGVPDERWGEAVCAVVQLSPGATLTLEELRESARGSIAGYKLPRYLVVVDEVQRTAVGKADYRWALATAREGVGSDS